MYTRCTIIDRLGCGGYSMVWLVRDKHTHIFVALKVGISRGSPAQRKYQVLEGLSSALELTTSEVQAKTGVGLSKKAQVYTLDDVAGMFL